MRRFVTAAMSLCLLLAGAPLSARAADNSPPVAVDDPATACGGAQTGNTYPVPEDWHDWTVLGLSCAPLVNDTDPDGDPLSVELVGQPAHGAAEVVPGVPDDWMAYRPEANYSTPRGDEPGGEWVSDTITYRAFDGQAYSNPATYRIWVMPVNDPPTFTPGPELIETHVGDGPVSIQWATDVSPGPANESSQHVSFEMMVPSADKFAVPPAIDSDGVLTFTPGDEPWLATVVVNAKDDGGLEDWNMPASAPFDQPDDTSDTVTFEIAIFPADPPAARHRSARRRRAGGQGGIGRHRDDDGARPPVLARDRRRLRGGGISGAATGRGRRLDHRHAAQPNVDRRREVPGRRRDRPAPCPGDRWRRQPERLRGVGAHRRPPAAGAVRRDRLDRDVGQGR